MILDEKFDRVVIISLLRTPERAARARAELLDKGLCENPVTLPATDGKLCDPPAWWQAGKGAWGCMMSHYRAVHDALHDGIETLLVIEDDAVWQQGAAAMLGEFMPQVPGDWGQIYLGGQHRNAQRPVWLDGRPAVMKAKSIHRTHCYAIHRRAMVKFLQHILHAPDYIDAKKNHGENRHVDHQLEHAQRRGDWPVYCPSWWIAGQGENLSCINGREQREQWWHIPWREANRRMPLVIVDQRPPNAEEMRHLHFGKNLAENEQWVDVGVRDCASADELLRIAGVISAEAYGAQRLPALPDLTGADPRVAWVKQKWLGPVMLLSEIPDLAALCDFPNSKVVEHPWLNPREERLAVVAEPSASTDELREKHTAPTVHQVWIGDKPMHERLAAYCATVERSFPEWNYKLWTEADMPALAENAVMPAVVNGAQPCNIGLRADVVRLEILRQQGGLYLDADFESLRPDLGPLFKELHGFAYADYHAGGPSNSVLYASAPANPVVQLYLKRIAGNADLGAADESSVLKASGPNRLSEVLGYYVGSWASPVARWVGRQHVANSYQDVTAFLVPVFFPYWFTDDNWATFNPGNKPDAWAAHHWQADWHPTKP